MNKKNWNKGTNQIGEILSLQLEKNRRTFWASNTNYHHGNSRQMNIAMDKYVLQLLVTILLRYLRLFLI